MFLARHGANSYQAEKDPVCLIDSSGQSSNMGQDTLAVHRTSEVFRAVIRRKRGIFTVAKAILEGSKATNSLLEGARKLVSTTFVKRYQKPGSYMQAMDDFDSVKPTHVRTFVLGDADGKIGLIGDRAIVIKSTSETGYPTLKIFKPKRIPNKAGDTVIYEIFYM